jgi:hypothetical protein
MNDDLLAGKHYSYDEPNEIYHYYCTSSAWNEIHEEQQRDASKIWQ